MDQRVVKALMAAQSQPQLTAAEPSLRDRIAWLLAGGAEKLGAGRYAQQDIASKVGGLIDFIPGVGDVVGFDDARRDFDAGNYGSAALNTGASIVGLVPGGGDIAAGVAKAIFGGIAAKTADRAALEAAQQMASGGVDRATVWNETGWFQGPDGKWRFEIDDSAAKFRPRAEDAFNNAAVGDLAFTHNTDGMMSHIPLHQAYDDLWKVDTQLTKGGGYPYEPSARYQTRESGKEEILIDAGNLDQAKSLNLHELQHAIQQREGFPGGGGPEDGALYDLLAGEVEASNVQKRMHMTADQRRATPPWATQDVLDELQIVRRR